MLEANDITKVYRRDGREVKALDGVSISVGAGEFVAVRGPSGCGKSTLLLACGGLLRPEGGRVLIGGQDPYAMGADGRAALRAAKIGFVFQQFHLVPYLTVLQNVLSPSLAAPMAGSAGRARELIERFGLAGRAEHLPQELSTGERQRTALARALLNRPGLLLADEPTGNLDADNAAAVLGYLREFAAGGGAVLLVTHDERAAAYAGRDVLLEAGRMQGMGEEMEKKR